MPRDYIESLLGEQERIRLILRQHWFILASSIFIEVVLIFIIFTISIVTAVILEQNVLIIVVIGFLLLLIPVITFTRDILNWSNRQFIVTNRRVMQISGVINKNVIDSSLEKVNDVRLVQSVFGRIFGYGDVDILTASEFGANRFKRIEDPILFKTTMLNAKEDLGHGDNSDDIDIPSLITQLDQLRQDGVLSDEEFQRVKTDLIEKL
jgi:uncharacterized membrane protein YdbT with pleckstrin-like domain